MCKHNKIFENMISEGGHGTRNNSYHVAYVGGYIATNTPETRFAGKNVSSVHAERRALWRARQRKSCLKDFGVF